MILQENCLLADNSPVISYLIFWKIRKYIANLSPAAVVIGALKVKGYAYAVVSQDLTHLFGLLCPQL